MSKILPCIKVNDNAINALRDYFFNNYKGEVFEKILKGTFYIEVFDGYNDSYKVLVEQQENETWLSMFFAESSSAIFKIILHDNKLNYVFDVHSYKAKTSFEAFNVVNREKLDIIKSRIIDLFSYVVTFFSEQEKFIPFQVSIYTKKNNKKSKRSCRVYSIDKEVVHKNMEIPFEVKPYDKLEVKAQINTSIHYVEKLEKVMEEEGEIDTQPLFIPFKEFLVDVDKQATEIYFKVNEERKILECVVYKSSINALALEISLEKDPNRNFKIYTFDEYDMMNYSDEVTPYILAKDLIHMMVVNFFYFTHYNIIVDKKEKKAEIIKKSVSLEEKKSYNNTPQNTVYLNLNPKKRVYSIVNSVKKNVAKRKKPEYRKFSWQVRGHFRHLKSGKKIWIAPYSCNRKKESKGSTCDTTKYVIKM